MILTSMTLLGLLLLLLGSGFWIGLTLLLVGVAGMALFTTSPAGLVMSTTIFGASTSWTLTALPLFIWMGDILYRSNLSESMFSGLSPWLNRIPGRLLHVNVFGCAVFAAVCGSSAATSATVGKISLPELKRRGYDEDMSIGTLAGSGTMGLMIPPSIMMIVYGVSAEVSIAQLFIAGVLPGLMLVVLFSGYVALWARLHPSRMPPPDADVARMSLRDKLHASRRLIPVLLLVAAVMGSIYLGIATATEAAALGVLGALVLSACAGTLTRRSFMEGLRSAMVTSCMMTFILACAAFLANAMGFTGVPNAIAEGIGALHLSPMMLLVVLTLFYIVMGCFLDGISIVVLTTAIIMPLIRNAGFDLVWFGIYIVLVAEMAQITPPVGFNLFVLQGMTRRDLLHIGRATLPFFFLLILAVVLVTAMPEIATYLPGKMK